MLTPSARTQRPQRRRSCRQDGGLRQGYRAKAEVTRTPLMQERSPHTFVTSVWGNGDQDRQ
eukprot:6403790-Prorocentrum_lima.AAC.1